MVPHPRHSISVGGGFAANAVGAGVSATGTTAGAAAGVGGAATQAHCLSIAARAALWATRCRALDQVVKGGKREERGEWMVERGLS